jgi:hypothetical protein
MRKPILFLIFILFLSAAVVIALQAEPSGTTELRGQVCAGEDNANSANTYGDACDGTYPASCTTDLLSCNDGSVETHTFSKNKFGGVRVQDYNDSVTDCGLVSEVFLCYEWWVSGGTLTNCLVAVDADGGGSYSTVSSTCPGTSANPGITCTNVTSLETWTCGNFFNTTGTRAFARLENSRSDAGSADTQSVDALFFNVTYSQETDPPIINLLSPSPDNASYTSTATPTINFSIVDLGSNIDTCTLELDHSNNTMTQNATGKNVYCNYTTSPLSEGSHNYTIFANDTLGNLGSNGTFFFTVDTVFPLISNGTGSEIDGDNVSRSNIYVNVSITETNFANVTFILKNDISTVNESVFTTATYTINWTNLADNNYTYNVSVRDLANNLNTTVERKITLDTTAPNVSTPVNPISGRNYSGIFVFNVSITDVTLSVDTVIFNLTNSAGSENATFNASQQGTSGYWNASINTSSFIDGTYNISIIANDSINNLNNSGLVHAIIFDNTPPGFTLNSPVNDTISQNTTWIINTSVTDNLLTSTVKIYGSNDSGFYNNDSLLYKGENVENGTEIIYNWTSPVLNVTTDMQLLMHFDLEGSENATFVYDEVGKNNGTKLTSGAPIWNESGKFGYALGFDGVDDSVSISDSNSLDLNGSFSISFWTYPTDLTKNQTFLSKGSGTSGTNYYIDYKTTTKIEFGFYNGAFRSVAVDASNITANQWNLITATLNDTSNVSTVYINGVNKGSLQFDFDVPANTFDLKLGSFPGFDQNFTGLIDELAIYNKTLTPSEVGNISQLGVGDWYWMVDVNDTASNLNVSETRVFTIGTIWDVTPTALDDVGSLLNVNVSVGTLVINNTHGSKNVTINITHDFGGVVTFNETMPLNLYNTNNGSNYRKIQINVTSPSSEGSTTINFNITANDSDVGGDSVPASRIVPVDIIATSGNPFLVSKFETAPSVVSQNNTGISLVASVTNKGQGIGKSVQLTFVLPSGWTNTSGTLIKSPGEMSVGEQNNFSLTVNVAGNATSGIVILYANLSGQNASEVDLTSNLLTVGSANVTVNEVTSGSGPSATTTTTTTTAGGGGGGGSGNSVSRGVSGGTFSKVIEITRGSGESFDIFVENNFPNSTLEDLSLKLSGFPEQYVSISPDVIDKVRYNRSGIFEVRLSAPSYKSFEVHSLRAIITGKIVRPEGVGDFKETQNIQLIIQEVGTGESRAILNKARKAIGEMRIRGFNTAFVERLLSEAERKIEGNNNKEAQDLANQIIAVKDLSFRVDDLIGKMKQVLDDPRKIWLIQVNYVEDVLTGTGSLLTGNVVRGNIKDQVGGFGSFLTGNVIFASEDINEILNLAIVAFERGDYNTALERAESARVLLILEGKGNFALFLYLYWNIILLGVIAFSVMGITGYKSYQKVSVSKRINDINLEESKIGKILVDLQRKYYSGKLSSVDYNSMVSRHRQKLSKIKKERLTLRNKRIKMLKPRRILQELIKETEDIENEIKKLQFDYYRDKKIGGDEYRLQFSYLNERLAEIEEERVTLNFKEDIKKAYLKEGLVGKKKIGKFELDKGVRSSEVEKAKELELKKEVNKSSSNEGSLQEFNKEWKEEEFKKPKELVKTSEKDRKNFEELGSRLSKISGWVKGVLLTAKDRSVTSTRAVSEKFNNKHKKGIAIVDHKIIDMLKESVKDKDSEGKWIKVNFDKSSIGSLEDEGNKGKDIKGDKK